MEFKKGGFIVLRLRLISILTSFALLFSYVGTSVSIASAEMVDELALNQKESDLAWLEIEEDNNSTTYDEYPEIFNNLEEIDWSTVDLVVVEDDIDWDTVPIEVEESDLEYAIQPFIIPLIARAVLSGGKYVIKWGSKVFKKAPTSKVTNALSSFKTVNYTVGKHTFKLTKTDMKHMLERHHPEYWDGSVKSSQTFYNPNLSVNDVKDIAISIAKSNRNKLDEKGTNSTFQVKGTVNGVEYVLGITKGHIKQLYPVK